MRLGPRTNAHIVTSNPWSADYVWRCAAQQTAANLTALGSKFWLAEFEMGIQYPPNAQLPYCTNKVCHQVRSMSSTLFEGCVES